MQSYKELIMQAIISGNEHLANLIDCLGSADLREIKDTEKSFLNISTDEKNLVTFEFSTAKMEELFRKYNVTKEFYFYRITDAFIALDEKHQIIRQIDVFDTESYNKALIDEICRNDSVKFVTEIAVFKSLKEDSRYIEKLATDCGIKIYDSYLLADFGRKTCFELRLLSIDRDDFLSDKFFKFLNLLKDRLKGFEEEIEAVFEEEILYHIFVDIFLSAVSLYLNGFCEQFKLLDEDIDISFINYLNSQDFNSI